MRKRQPITQDGLRDAIRLSRALSVLSASERLYADVAQSVRDSTTPQGDPDVPILFRQLHAALAAFAPRAIEIRNLLSEFEASTTADAARLRDG